jgi:hypothetical protein
MRPEGENHRELIGPMISLLDPDSAYDGVSDFRLTFSLTPPMGRIAS